MKRTLLAVIGVFCLSGSAASYADQPGSGTVPLQLTLDKDLSTEHVSPHAGSVADTRKPKCRRVPIRGSRITRKVCEARLDRQHLRNAERAGIRALRQGELGITTSQ